MSAGHGDAPANEGEGKGGWGTMMSTFGPAQHRPISTAAPSSPLGALPRAHAEPCAQTSDATSLEEVKIPL